MEPRRTLRSIEDRTYGFAVDLIRTYRVLRPRDEAERVIWRQLLKSGTSAGANSAEGPGTQSRREWITRRHISLKEMRESHFWLRLLQDTRDDNTTSLLHQLIDESSQLVAILTAALKTARRNDSAGRQDG